MSSAQLASMVAHLERQLPEEACGLIGGKATRAELLMPVENILHSPVRFQMAPMEQFRAFQKLEDLELELLAIFHSHPTGPAHPSATDLAEFAYPGTLVLIASRWPGEEKSPARDDHVLEWEGWQVRAFFLEHNGYHEVKLALLE